MNDQKDGWTNDQKEKNKYKEEKLERGIEEQKEKGQMGE